jgi:quercetin dioxygenase-like cupin family protein
MTETANFFRLDAADGGLPRQLGPGLLANIFVGDQAMLSVVTCAPHAVGSIHSHPEEQWGVMLEGSGIRIQDGVEVPVAAGDFWRTPGGVVHGLKAGPQGCKVIDIFAPPRDAYRKPGSGFGAG